MTNLEPKNLKPNTQYTFQVRGVANNEPITPWSQYWTFTTDRDRTPPPPVVDITVVYPEGCGGDDGSTTYWYDRDVKFTWRFASMDELGITDPETYSYMTRDFKGKWVFRFETFFGEEKFVIATDAVSSPNPTAGMPDIWSWTLTESNNRSIFAIFNSNLNRTFGCPAFKTIQIFGMDMHGNPSYNGQPHADGPDYKETGIISYGNGKPVVNPPPDPISLYTGDTYVNGADFRGPDLRIKWNNTISFGPGKNMDTDFIVIELTPAPDPPVAGYTPVSRQYIVSREATEWTLPYDINQGTFAIPAYPYGMPRFAVSIYAVDVFGQYSQSVGTIAVNLPPTDKVGDGNWTAKAGRYLGYTINQTNSENPVWVPNHIDGVLTRFYEKVSKPTGPEDDLTGFTFAADLYDKSKDIPTKTLDPRWIKGYYVDVFGQKGPVTIPIRYYPVTPKAAVDPDVTAPAPPYDCHTEIVSDGDITFMARQLFTWMPRPDERLTGHKIRYGPYVNGEVLNKSAYTVDASREYVTYINGNIVSFRYDHSFKENDWVAMVNYGPVEDQVKRQIKKVISSKTVEVTGDPFPVYEVQGTDDESYEGKPSLDKVHTALVRCGVVLDLYPGTDYFYEICSEGRLGNLGNYTQVINPDRTEDDYDGVSDYDETGPFFLTGGNRLVAQAPLEIGTIGDSLPIVGAAVTDTEGVVRVELKDTSPARTSPVQAGMIKGQLVSIRDCHEDVNGRWRIKDITKVGPDVLNITNRVLTSNVVTITTSRDHNLAAGEEVVINITSGTNTTVFNGTYPIVATPTPTTFTYAKNNPNISTSACNGTVTVPGEENQWDIAFKIYDTFKTRSPMKFGAQSGRAMAVTFALGAQVDGYSNSGLYMDDSNLWLQNTGEFRAGTNYGTSAWQGFEWNPSTSRFNVSGSLTAKSGYFDGNVFIRQNGALVVGAGADIHEEYPIAVDSGLKTITFALRTPPPDYEKYVVVKMNNKKVYAPMSTGYPFTKISDINLVPDILIDAFNDNWSIICVDLSGNTPYTAPEPAPRIAEYVDSKYHNTHVNGKCFFGAWTGITSEAIESYSEYGQATFQLTQWDDSGNISSYGSIGGFQIFPDRLQSDDATVGISPGHDTTGRVVEEVDLIWAGGKTGETPTAKFRVKQNGHVLIGGTSGPGRLFVGNNDNTGNGAYEGLIVVGSTAEPSPPNFPGLETALYIKGGGSGVYKSMIYSGAGEFANDNTPIYYDNTGRFSLKSFVQFTSTSALFKQTNGSIALATSFYDGISLNFKPNPEYLNDTTDTQFIINRDSGSGDSPYAAGIYWPSRSGSGRTFIANDDSSTATYPFVINMASNGVNIGYLTINTSGNVFLSGTGGVRIGSSILNAAYIKAEGYASTIYGSTVNIWHALNSTTTFAPISGDLNIVLSSIPQISNPSNGDILVRNSSTGTMRLSGVAIADIATQNYVETAITLVKAWANDRFQLK